MCESVAYRAVARRGSQISGCDSDVIEGSGLSVELYILSHSKLTLHWGNHELVWQKNI